jgi:competence protein ComGC
MRPLFLVILLALVSVLVLGVLPVLQARRQAAKDRGNR